MGVFRVTWDLDRFGGAASATTEVEVVANVDTIVDRAGKVVWDRTVRVPTTAGGVDLPATDNDPGVFGFIVKRKGSLDKPGSWWRLPARAAGDDVDLSDPSITSTTPLPVPPGYDQQLDEVRGRIDVLEQTGPGGGPALVPDPERPGFYITPAAGGLVPDPEHPGYYLTSGA